MTIDILIRKNLIYQMRTHGFTNDEQFILATGFPKSTLWQIKNLKRSPRINTLESLARALSIPLIALLQIPRTCPLDWDDL